MPHGHHGAWESSGFPIVLILLAFAALVYVRGWLRLRSASLNFIPGWQAGSLLIGLFLIWVAVASPVAKWDHELLTVHMIQHLLLMTVAAPLILLGQPVMAFLLALPPRFARVVVCPMLRWRPVQQLGSWLAQPLVCWLAATAALVGWHIPAALTLGLRSEAWHVIELGSFLGTGLLFWWPVVQPWPSVSSPSWSTVLYLLFATLPCDILSGFLVFSERIAYPAYLSASRHTGLSVLGDQQLAGALMWTVVTIVYLVVGTVLAARLLSIRCAPESRLEESTDLAVWQKDSGSVEMVP